SAVDFGTATVLTFTNGVSTAGGSMKLYAAGSANVTASAGDGGSGSTAITTSGADRLGVAVSPAALAKFAVQLTSPQTNGAAFTGANTLTAEDAYGTTLNTFAAALDNVTISAAAALSGSTSGLHGSNVLDQATDFVSGVADLTGLGLTYTGNAAAGALSATAQTG